MKIAIQNATASQLAKYASIHHGIDVVHTKGRDHIIGLLRSVGFEDEEIEIEDQAERVVRHDDPAPTGSRRRMVRLTILEQDIPGSSEGREPVPVSVNGSLMYIPRGKEVEIPYPYYHALSNAKYRQFDTAPDEHTPLGESRDVPRFPISVHHIDPDVNQAA